MNVPVSQNWLSPKTITQVGVPSVIALGLVYLLANVVLTDIPKLQAYMVELKTGQGLIQAQHSALKEQFNTFLDELKRGTSIQQQICKNTSKTTQAFASCIDQ